MRRMRAPTMVSLLVLATGCTKPGAEPRRFGVLPNAVTSAEPGWIPFTIRAGSQVEPQRAERNHFVELRRLTMTGGARAPQWSADGTELSAQRHDPATGCRQSLTIHLDSGVIEQSGDDEACAKLPFRDQILGDGNKRSSPDGTTVVWHQARNATGAEPQTEPSAAAAHATFSVMISGALGQHPRALVARGHYNLTPTFMADSRRVLYASDWDAAPDSGNASPGLELYLIDPDAPPGADGQPVLQRITFAPGDDADPAVSPDGRWLAFTSCRDVSGCDVYAARWAD